MKRMGIDVGGVLKEHSHESNLHDGETRWVPKAEWALKRLHKIRKLYIISRVHPGHTNAMRNLLRNSFVIKYIPESRWFFVPQRIDKVTIMQQHGIGTLVDDRRDIIEWVKEAGLCGILFRSKEYPNWKSIVQELQESQRYIDMQE